MDAATFWNAVAAIGTCVAAIAAVVTIVIACCRTRSIRMKGEWIGDLGDKWTFESVLRVDGNNGAGRIDWTLRECPAELPWAGRIGECGTERVDGTLTDRILTLHGCQVVANSDLLALNNYTIRLALSGHTFEGESEPQQHTQWWDPGSLQAAGDLFLLMENWVSRGQPVAHSPVAPGLTHIYQIVF